MFIAGELNCHGVGPYVDTPFEWKRTVGLELRN
jgi:hypothetical protein